ncbi:MAG: fasciclin domain-containing protein [Planctomycetota bacterium]
MTGDSDESDIKDIVDTAIEAGSLKTLISAVKTADLVDSLKGKGPLTVFAPTDEAFEKLPEGAVEDLLKPENRDKLIAVLTYHVVPGKILLSQQSWETLQGQSIVIKTPGSFQVNEAEVLKSDIVTSNGVIHVIDKVLLPPED